MWTKSDFEQYLSEELKWQSFDVAPYYSNLNGQEGGDDKTLFFGQLNFLGSQSVNSASLQQLSNKVTNPEELWVHPWGGNTPGANAGTDPFGGINAASWNYNSAWVYKNQIADVVDAQDQVCVGIFIRTLRYNNAQTVEFYPTDNTSYKADFIYNSTDEQWEPNGGASIRVVDVGNGWYLCQAVMDLSSSDSSEEIVIRVDGSTLGELHMFGAHIFTTGEFQNYGNVGIANTRVGTRTLIDGSPLPLDNVPVLASSLEDYTGLARFIGYKAIRHR